MRQLRQGRGCKAPLPILMSRVVLKTTAKKSKQSKGQFMAENTRDELLELLKKCNPRTRSTTMQAVEGRASEDKVGYVKEELSFMEPDFTTRRVTFISSRICDCGKLVSQDNALAGVCQYHGCTRFTCKECTRVCSRCGRMFCPDHGTVYRDGDIFCTRCRPIKWLRLFFDLGKKKVSK